MYHKLIKFLWPYIRPYKWYYALMLFGPLLSSFYPFVYNYAIKLFVDTMVSDKTISYQDVLYPIVLFVGIQIGLDIFWRLSNYAEWKSEPYVRRDIILKPYDYVQHHSYAFFQNNFTGMIVSKLKGILSGYDKFWAELHHGLGLRILSVVVSLFALSYVNLKIGLFLIAWACVYTPTMYILSKRLNLYSYEETESRHKITGLISDRITNVLSLLSFAARKRELKDLDQTVSGDFVPKQIRLYKFDFMMQIIGGVFYISMFVFILLYMIHLRQIGDVTVGDFAFVFGMTLAVAENIWHATINLQEFARAMGDFASSLSILDAPQQNLDQEGATPLKIQQASIIFENLSFRYPAGSQIFENLNLEIKPGEKIGLVGETGSGKSTIVNLLLRYFEPESGSIKISGCDIGYVTQDSLRAQIALIPQDTLLFHRTLFENIRYGNPNASDEDVIRAAKHAHAHEFIEGLGEGYDTEVGERGIKLSGGQRQRIAIARAILKDAPILILDEATSALDSQTEKFIQESLHELIKDRSKTVIAVAHRLSTLKDMDRILVLEAGRIVEEGSHESLVHNPNSAYKKLWDLQKI